MSFAGYQPQPGQGQFQAPPQQFQPPPPQGGFQSQPTTLHQPPTQQQQQQQQAPTQQHFQPPPAPGQQQTSPMRAPQFFQPPPMGAPGAFQPPPPVPAAAGGAPVSFPPQQQQQQARPPAAFAPPPPTGFAAPPRPGGFAPPPGGFVPPPAGFVPPPSGFAPPPPTGFAPPPPATNGLAPASGAAPPATNGPMSFAPPSSFTAPPPFPGQAPPAAAAPAQSQPGNGLPGRFPAPPPVSVASNPNVAAAIAQQRDQVVFNQVQPLRPFDDTNLQSPAVQHNGFAQHLPSQPPSQQPRSQPLGQQFNLQSPHGMAIPPSNAQLQQPPLQLNSQPQGHAPQQQQWPQQAQPMPQQQQYHSQQPPMPQQQQQQQHMQPPPQQQQQQQHMQPPPQQNMYQQQQQAPQQQQQQQQQQQYYADSNQQQYQQSNGYPVQSPVNTPGGSLKPAKRVDRIDPKQIPRRMDFPTSVRFHTRSMTLPPAATADFVCVDEGNCSPRFIRMTTNNIAHEAELIDSTRLCIGAIIQPLANLADGEEAVPIVHYPKGPMRCSGCMAYVNPFFQFVDNGNAFTCNMCGRKNDVPDEYRCNLDANGLRRDRHDRPELSRGSVEFEVGADFIARPIVDPVFLFVIDVSYGAVVSGLVGAAITAVRTVIDQLAVAPADGSENRLKVGIITYDQSVHFYSLKAPRTEPLMLVMSDVDEPFVPCPPDEICVRVGVEENRALLHATLDMLSAVYDRTKVTENLPVFGAAITSAADTLALLGGGKILILQSNLPQQGAGKLEHRDQISLYHTPQEKTLQVPQTSFYQTLATRCAESAITVDLFVCANGYVDLATVGALTEKTGGALFSYPGFNARKDGLALQRDLFHDCTRVTGYDGIMIVRCSNGLKVAEHFGNFYHRKVQEMELATINADATFGVRLEHEGKLKDKTEACLQCALLYTTASGHRRIRVHTISVPVTSVMSNIFRFADLDAIVNLSLKQAVRQLLDTTTCADAQNALTMACIESLYVYRKFCASATSAGQLILPEPLKLLPLCTLGLVKHPLFQDGLAADERAFLFHFVNSMPCYVSVAFVCPRLFNLTNFDHAQACVPDEAGRVFLPAPLTLSSESVSNTGLYLLDDGRYMYLYIGGDLPAPFLEEVFLIKGDGKSTAGQYRIRHVPNAPHHVSSRINVLIGTLRKNKPNFQNLQIISRRPPANQPQTPMINASGHQQGPSPSPTNRSGWETFESLDESLFFSHLIEDSVIKPQDPTKKDAKSNVRQPNTMSYIDFLCFIHKRIQAKFL